MGTEEGRRRGERGTMLAYNSQCTRDAFNIIQTAQGRVAVRLAISNPCPLSDARFRW